MVTSNPDRYSIVGDDGSRRTDWIAWHSAFNDGNGSLTRRLAVVQSYLRQALLAAPGARVLSLCAGDGRDVIDVCRATIRRCGRSDRVPELAAVRVRALTEFRRGGCGPNTSSVA